jgi:hypothetical protein
MLENPEVMNEVLSSFNPVEEVEEEEKRIIEQVVLTPRKAIHSSAFWKPFALENF